MQSAHLSGKKAFTLSQRYLMIIKPEFSSKVYIFTSFKCAVFVGGRSGTGGRNGGGGGGGEEEGVGGEVDEADFYECTFRVFLYESRVVHTYAGNSPIRDGFLP